ncbi:hypothetical protein ALQ79_200026 [Pseudomonas amygdali pv. lachrymans]|nr:hypothetical protein ALQ79_200026 [Pseudomonas amygdali pv. lachrymans]
MSKTGILDIKDLARGIDIASSLDLRFDSRLERRKAQIHLTLIIATAAVTAVNLLPRFQAPLIWAGCAVSALLLARTLPSLRSSLRKTSATRESALQIQSLLIEAGHCDQAFAFKVSKFQPNMRLRVVTVTKDNCLCLRTYSVEHGSTATLEIESRQVYVKSWLSKTFGDKWSQLAQDRGLSTPRARGPQRRSTNLPSTPME